MQFRPATPEDAALIETFLVRHPDTSMFLRSNLRAFGPCGGEAPIATRMWIQSQAGRTTGVLGLSTAGFLLVQLPEGARSGDLHRILGGSEIKGIFGATDQVHDTRAMLGLAGAPTQLDDDEPLYSLDLDHLVMPVHGATLRAASAADREILEGWRRSYLQETMHFSAEEARDLASGDVEGMLERGTLMVLEDEQGAACAMTSFNAILPDMVQIGNVYTPPEQRGKGHARRAVALHLERARAAGVARAILFASGPSASRAYEAIGFELAGKFTLLVFAGMQKVAEAA